MRATCARTHASFATTSIFRKETTHPFALSGRNYQQRPALSGSQTEVQRAMYVTSLSLSTEFQLELQKLWENGLIQPPDGDQRTKFLPQEMKGNFFGNWGGRRAIGFLQMWNLSGYFGIRALPTSSSSSHAPAPLASHSQPTFPTHNFCTSHNFGRPQEVPSSSTTTHPRPTGTSH